MIPLSIVPSLKKKLSIVPKPHKKYKKNSNVPNNTKSTPALDKFIIKQYFFFCKEFILRLNKGANGVIHTSTHEKKNLTTNTRGATSFRPGSSFVLRLSTELTGFPLLS